MYESVGRRRALQFMAAGGLTALAGGPTALAQTPGHMPDAAQLSFLKGEDQVFAFRNMDKLFPTRSFHKGPKASALPAAPQQLDIHFDHAGQSWDIAKFMAHNRTAGLVAIHDGQVVIERYGLGHNAASKWTSFSVAKSLTSTLVGAAIKDGHFQSVNDPMTKYLPMFKKTAFDGVTLRDLLRMSGGDGWNESYTEANSDFNQDVALMAKRNMKGAMLQHMMSLKRVTPPGTVNSYHTGEPYLLAECLAAALGGPLSPYVTEKIWTPVGMEADGYWVLSSEGGTEWGGACFSATSRDYARFGQFIMGGGKAGGRQIVPDDWVAEATQASAPAGPKNAPTAYGYLWWIGPGPAFRAVGIFGQQIYIDPTKRLVISIQSAWPTAGDRDNNGPLATAFTQAVGASFA